MDIHFFPIDSPFNKSFSDFIGRHFQADDNLFVVMADKASLRFPLSERADIQYLRPTDQNRAQFYNLIHQAGRVFAHALFEPALTILATYPGKKKFLYAVWGSDFAPFIFRDPLDRLDYATRNFFTGPERPPVTYRQIAAEYDSWRKMNLALANAAGILSLSDYESRVVRQVFAKDLPWRPFGYSYTVDFKLMDEAGPPPPELDFKKRFAKVVMAGHSGNPHNNHITLFDQLARADRDDFCVVSPLSYGPPRAIEALIEYGRQKLGGRFFPITDFLPPPQYAALLNQVDVFLLNSLYQGAVANIGLLLYRGRKVYINPRNILVNSIFESHGLAVNQLGRPDGPDSWLENLWEELDEETQRRNREKMVSFASEQRLADLYAQLLADTAP